MHQQLTDRREQLVKDYFDANDTQDWAAIESFFAPEMEFRVGNSAGTTDLQALKSSVVANLEQCEVTEMLHLVDAFVHDAENRSVVCTMEVRLARANGRTFRGPCCAIFDFDDDDRITCYHAYLDVGDFWV